MKNFENWQEVPSTIETSQRFERSLVVNTEPGRRSWLRVDGVTDHIALWLDDKYIGEPDTDLEPRTFEVVTASPHARFCVEFLERNDLALPDVELYETGPIRISRHKVLCTEANNEGGALDISIEFDALEPAVTWVRTVVTDESGSAVFDHARRHSLASGRNRMRWTEPVDRPTIWRAGPSGTHQPLYVVNTTVSLSGDIDPSDRAELVTGFRSVAKSGKLLRINGREFAAERRIIDRPEPTKTATDQLIQFDRIFPSNTYEHADRTGLLLCQRLPGNLDGARRVIDVLAHHPSIVAWLRPHETRRPRLPGGDAFVRTVERADPTRPLLPR